MLCWTCPECGTENSPALRECPSCPPAAPRPSQPAEEVNGNRANDGILALVQNLETIHAVPILSTVPEHVVEIRENGRPSHSSIAATLTEEYHLEPAPELTRSFDREDDVAGPTHEAMLMLAEETLAIPMKESVDSLVRPLVESVALVETKEPAFEAAARTENAAVPVEEVLPETALEAAAPNPTVPEAPGDAAHSGEETAPAPESIEPVANEPSLCEPVQAEPVPQKAQQVAVLAAQIESSPVPIESDRADERPGVAVAEVTQEPVSMEVPPSPMVAEAVHTKPVPEAPEPVSMADRIQAATEPPQAGALAPPLEGEPARELVSVAGPIQNTAAEPAQFETAPVPSVTESVHREPVHEARESISTPDPVQAAADPLQPEALHTAPVAEPVHEPAPEPVEPVSALASPSNDGFVLEPPVSDPAKPDLIDEATEVLAVPVSEAQLAIDWDRPTEAFTPSIDTPAIDTEAICAALGCNAEELVETIGRKLDIEHAAILSVAASFERRPVLSLLGAPAEIVTAPAPPIFETIGMRSPRILPMAPPPANLTSLTSPPQPPTLAGPCLPPELRNPTESRVSKDSPKSRSMPGWVISFIAAMLLLLIGVTAYQYFNSQGGGTASATAQSASVSGGAQADAVAKSLEISGLRLTKSWSGKQQVRFLIINHSAQDLSGVTAQVTVKSDGSPVLLIQAPIRSLASNQSKEIRTDLDSDVPASVLSDWQALRTEIRLTGQQ